MRKDKKKLFLDIGVFLSSTLCFLGAFLVLYHSSRPSVQAMEDQPKPVQSPALHPDKTMKDIDHQKMLTEALRKKPDHVPVLLELARLEAESGNARKSSEYLREVLQCEPQNLDAKLNLGKQMFEMGQIEEAIRLNQEILETQPDHPDALYNLGAIYGNRGNKERALFFWKQLVDLHPDSESGVRAREMMAKL
jgi:tetratricopeptide (TPR) repeat protein